MQLTQFTDYALRTLIYIATKNDICTISEISQSYGISKNHLVKVAHTLSKIGVLKTTRGNQGGIQLNLPPTDINIGELVKKIEPNFFIVECFDKKNGRCIISPACKLKSILHEATENFMSTLFEYTLEDLIVNKNTLKKLYQKTMPRES